MGNNPKNFWKGSKLFLEKRQLEMSRSKLFNVMKRSSSAMPFTAKKETVSHLKVFPCRALEIAGFLLSIDQRLDWKCPQNETCKNGAQEINLPPKQTCLTFSESLQHVVTTPSNKGCSYILLSYVRVQ